MAKETVLVTGGTGFVGVHVVLRLLEAGYTVRTTVRSRNREPEVREMLRRGGMDAGDRLSFVLADLMQDQGWTEAVADCRFVHHVASPFPAAPPKHENELIGPAREGTLRVLRAARDAGVERLVLTSSVAAITYGHPASRTAAFTEADWTDVTSAEVSAYQKSKTLAERAAWDFVEREPGMELTSINPAGIFGPALGRDVGTSLGIVQRVLEGKYPGMPRARGGIIDVRDVAELHLRAMTTPAAAGQRFLASATDFVPLVEIARILKQHLGDAARRVNARELPDWVVRLVAVFDANARLVLPELGRQKHASNARSRELLGWTPRSNEEAIVASGQSLLDLGLVAKA